MNPEPEVQHNLTPFGRVLHSPTSKTTGPYKVIRTSCCDSAKDLEFPLPLPAFSEHHHLIDAIIGLTILTNCFT